MNRLLSRMNTLVLLALVHANGQQNALASEPQGIGDLQTNSVKASPTATVPVPKPISTTSPLGCCAAVSKDDIRLYFPSVLPHLSLLYAKTFIPKGAKISIENVENRDASSEEARKLNGQHEYVLTACCFAVGKTAKTDLSQGHRLSALDLNEYNQSDGSLDTLLADEIRIENERSERLRAKYRMIPCW
jgi:hypothetical protein